MRIAAVQHLLTVTPSLAQPTYRNRKKINANLPTRRHTPSHDFTILRRWGGYFTPCLFHGIRRRRIVTGTCNIILTFACSLCFCFARPKFGDDGAFASITREALRQRVARFSLKKTLARFQCSLRQTWQVIFAIFRAYCGPMALARHDVLQFQFFFFFCGPLQPKCCINHDAG